MSTIFSKAVLLANDCIKQITLCPLTTNIRESLAKNVRKYNNIVIYNFI